MTRPDYLDQPADRHIIIPALRWLLQCWLRWPPGRHSWAQLADGRVCRRCGVLR